jgi:fluoride ion exporter CrcB/FEX
MIVLEFWLTWAAFTMGYAAAKTVAEVNVAISPYCVYMTKYYRKPPVKAYDQAVDALEGDIELQQPGQHSSSTSPSRNAAQCQLPSSDTSVGAPQGQPTADRPVPVLNDDEDIHESKRESSELNTERAGELDMLQALDAVTETAQVQDNIAPRSPSPAAAQSVRGTSEPATVATAAVPQPDLALPCLQRTQLYAYFERHEYYIWGGLFSLTAVILWVILILEPQMGYFDHRVWRNTYRSVALAPLGAWIRWGLTRFPRIKAAWPEMHPQTLIANLTAVLLMCALNVFAHSSWVVAVNAGINGSLSTVSTFFAELHNLYLEKGPLISLR